jgi:hypothetical protein
MGGAAGVKFEAPEPTRAAKRASVDDGKKAKPRESVTL